MSDMNVSGRHTVIDAENIRLRSSSESSLSSISVGSDQSGRTVVNATKFSPEEKAELARRVTNFENHGTRWGAIIGGTVGFVVGLLGLGIGAIPGATAGAAIGGILGRGIGWIVGSIVGRRKMLAERVANQSPAATELVRLQRDAGTDSSTQTKRTPKTSNRIKFRRGSTNRKRHGSTNRTGNTSRKMQKTGPHYDRLINRQHSVGQINLFAILNYQQI